MKAFKYIMSGLLLLGATSMLTSCGQEDPIPGSNDYEFDNPFAVPTGATGEEAEIRRQFFNETGVYIVFHDLLRTYTDRFGNQQTETVAINYEINGSKGTSYDYDEMNDAASQKRAAEVIKKHILPRISGGKLRPFSILAVNSIYEGSDRDEVTSVNNYRTLALAMSMFESLTDENEIKAAASSILKEFIKTKADYSSPEFADFKAISDDLYLEDIVDVTDDWDADRDITVVYKLGFLTYQKSSRYSWDYLVSAKNDFRDYIDMIFEYSDAEIRAMYGQYPVIIRKYETFKNILEELGLTF